MSEHVVEHTGNKHKQKDVMIWLCIGYILHFNQVTAYVATIGCWEAPGGQAISSFTVFVKLPLFKTLPEWMAVTLQLQSS